MVVINGRLVFVTSHWEFMILCWISFFPLWPGCKFSLTSFLIHKEWPFSNYLPGQDCCSCRGLLTALTAGKHFQILSWQVLYSLVAQENNAHDRLWKSIKGIWCEGRQPVSSPILYSEVVINDVCQDNASSEALCSIHSDTRLACQQKDETGVCSFEFRLLIVI